MTYPPHDPWNQNDPVPPYGHQNDPAPPYGHRNDPAPPYGHQYDPAPAYGYQVPGGFGYSGPAYHPEHDPLVPPPGSGYSTWIDWVRATLGRTWESLGLILLVTVALPEAVMAILGFAAGQALTLAPADASGLFDSAAVGAGTVLLVLVLTVAGIFLKALGWAAGIWAVTQRAAGQAAPLPDALRAGLARALPMFGWYLLAGLIVVVGLVFCILPGLYLAVATSLFSFVVMFERGANPIGRSFSLVNNSFGPVLGRVLSLALVYMTVGILVGCAFGGAAVAGSAAGVSGVQLLGQLLQAALGVPLNALLLVGLLITYTQVRSRTEPLSTNQLWAVANS